MPPIVVASAVIVPARPTSTFWGPVSCSEKRAQKLFRGRWSCRAPGPSVGAVMCAVSGRTYAAARGMPMDRPGTFGP